MMGLTNSFVIMDYYIITPNRYDLLLRYARGQYWPGVKCRRLIVQGGMGLLPDT